MKHKSIQILLAGAMTLGAILACNFNADSPTTEEPAAETPTLSPTLRPTASPTATLPAIQHNDIPINLPAERKNQAGDHDSSETAAQKRAPGGDRFTFGRFERPFNATSMDIYFPYLDILNTAFYEDETWIYAVITLKGGDDSGRLAGKYAFEIDSDLDGRGEWLVLATKPSSSEWNVKGVQAWFDTDRAIGGSVSVGADNDGNGNGYETLLVDSGQGEDPDLAWARIAPDNPTAVELALKRSLLESDKSYMIGAWAGNDALDPALFDFNDRMTHEQAGTSLVELENFYPIKGLAELDNACRVAIGFVPNGNEPGSCVSSKPKGQPGACSGQYVCLNFGNQQVCVCNP